MVVTATHSGGLRTVAYCASYQMRAWSTSTHMRPESLRPSKTLKSARLMLVQGAPSMSFACMTSREMDA